MIVPAKDGSARRGAAVARAAAVVAWVAVGVASGFMFVVVLLGTLLSWLFPLCIDAQSCDLWEVIHLGPFGTIVAIVAVIVAVAISMTWLVLFVPSRRVLGISALAALVVLAVTGTVALLAGNLVEAYIAVASGVAVIASVVAWRAARLPGAGS